MSKEPIGDVWTLETPSEELASEDLGAIVSLALEKRSTWARNYLRKLWDNESWSSIKEKLLTEGSTWYVWWMDGVRAFMKYNKMGRNPVIRGATMAKRHRVKAYTRRGKGGKRVRVKAHLSK